MWTNNLPGPPSDLGKKAAEVVYFVGCVNAVFPCTFAVAPSFVQILEQAEVDCGLLGKGEWCCGYPLYLSGELDRAREVIRHNVEVVRATGGQAGCDDLSFLFPFPEACLPGEVGGAHLWIRRAARHRVPGRPKGSGQAACAISHPGGVVTYQDPCDLGRKGGVFKALRRILVRFPGVTLEEMKENR